MKFRITIFFFLISLLFLIKEKNIWSNYIKDNKLNNEVGNIFHVDYNTRDELENRLSDERETDLYDFKNFKKIINGENREDNITDRDNYQVKHDKNLYDYYKDIAYNVVSYRQNILNTLHLPKNIGIDVERSNSKFEYKLSYSFKMSMEIKKIIELRGL